jgi:periplasmic divalent cation tolerance protein
VPDETRQVVTTIGSRAAADELARAVVSDRLAACAQISGPVESSYWWRGELETATEWLVIFKTTAARYPALEAYLLAHHPYEVPEVVCLPIVAGNPAYLRWLADETHADGAASTDQ